MPMKAAAQLGAWELLGAGEEAVQSDVALPGLCSPYPRSAVAPCVRRTNLSELPLFVSAEHREVRPLVRLD